MKIRSLDELQSQLQKDMAWRKKEFTTLKFLVAKSRSHEANIIRRAAVTLLYAHWEGHIKFSAKVYLKYLRHIAPRYKEMTENFKIISISEKFNQGFSVKKFDSQSKIFEYLTQDSNERFDVDDEQIIDTESNLKYEVFFNILGQLGLATSVFDLKEHFINSKLVKFRNSIAHGERVNGDELEAVHKELETELMIMIENFDTLIIDSAERKLYLKAVS